MIDMQDMQILNSLPEYDFGDIEQELILQFSLILILYSDMTIFNPEHNLN